MKIEHNERNIIDQAIYRNVVKELFNFSSDDRGYSVLDVLLRIAEDNPEHSLEDLKVPLREGVSLSTVGGVACYLATALKHGRAAIGEYLSLLQDGHYLSEPMYCFDKERVRLTDVGHLVPLTEPLSFPVLPYESFSGLLKVIERNQFERLQLALEEDFASIVGSSHTMTVEGKAVLAVECLDQQMSEWEFTLKSGNRHRVDVHAWKDLSVRFEGDETVVEFPYFQLRVS